MMDVSSDEDDLGAVDFEAECASGVRLLHRPMRNWVRNRGRWSRAKKCPAYAPAVCGIKSREAAAISRHIFI